MHTPTLAHLATATAIYVAALALTLLLAAYCTPPHWWRRLNLRALTVTLGGTLLLGHLLAGWAGIAPLSGARGRASPFGRFATPAAPVTAASPAVPPPASATAGTPAVAAERAATLRPFAVHRDLNLRLAAGVEAPRMLTVPAGALVTPTGMRHGDWWQISACVHGQCSTGWASSLWLRRAGE